MGNSSNNRIEFIDLAKGICILLVVTLHIAPEIGSKFSFLTCLRMPLYYCLSGLFFKEYGGFSKFITKKTDKLLIPFIGWYLVSYLIYYVRVLAIGEPEHIFRLSDLFLEPEFYNGSLWFLLSLFWCNILYFLISKISGKLGVQALLVIGCGIIGWLWGYADLHNFLYIGTTFTCLPFFFMGRQLFNSGILSSENHLWKDITILCVCAGVSIFYIFFAENPVYMRFYLNYLVSGDYISLYILSIALVVMTLIICKFIGRIPYVSYLGRYSIIVLVTHGLLNNIFNRSIRHIFGMPLEDATFQLLLLVVIIALMALIIPLCRKFLPYISAQKSLLEDKIMPKFVLKTGV